MTGCWGRVRPRGRDPSNETCRRLSGPEKAGLKKRALTDRARADLALWLEGARDGAARPAAAE
ncbi:hypothetical protein CCS92_35195 [Methylobacterium radiotolerans]|nr:hypothetical protein CCS92_35195 [Methylobacterium radiotolerans]